MENTFTPGEIVLLTPARPVMSNAVVFWFYSLGRLSHAWVYSAATGLLLVHTKDLHQPAEPLSPSFDIPPFIQEAA
jgi:hypothetical protein